MLRQLNQNLEIPRFAGGPMQRGMLDFRPRRLHIFCGAVQVNFAMPNQNLEIPRSAGLARTAVKAWPAITWVPWPEAVFLNFFIELAPCMIHDHELRGCSMARISFRQIEPTASGRGEETALGM